MTELANRLAVVEQQVRRWCYATMVLATVVAGALGLGATRGLQVRASDNAEFDPSQLTAQVGVGFGG